MDVSATRAEAPRTLRPDVTCPQIPNPRSQARYEHGNGRVPTRLHALFAPRFEAVAMLFRVVGRSALSATATTTNTLDRRSFLTQEWHHLGRLSHRSYIIRRISVMLKNVDLCCPRLWDMWLRCDVCSHYRTFHSSTLPLLQMLTLSPPDHQAGQGRVSDSCIELVHDRHPNAHVSDGEEPPSAPDRRQARRNPNFPPESCNAPSRCTRPLVQLQADNFTDRYVHRTIVRRGAIVEGPGCRCGLDDKDCSIFIVSPCKFSPWRQCMPASGLGGDSICGAPVSSLNHRQHISKYLEYLSMCRGPYARLRLDFPALTLQGNDYDQLPPKFGI